MDTGDTILVIAVVASLAIGVASILHNGRMQREQQSHSEQIQLAQQNHDERIRETEHGRVLLGEIVDWATDVLDLGFGSGVVIRRSFGPEEEFEREGQEIADYGNRIFKFQGLAMRGTYIVKVAEVFGEELKSASAEVQASINEMMERIFERAQAIAEPPEEGNGENVKDKLSASGERLKGGALQLIELATALKTKSISDARNDSVFRTQ